MRTRRGSAGAKAAAFLRAAIAERTARGNGRLPTVKDLAESAGVAAHTMWKAVQRLTSEGALSAAPRRGITINHTPDPPRPEPAARRARWEQVYETIRRDLVRGVARPGDLLPPGKELVRSHGTTHRTLAKALRRLVDEGLLVPFRKTHRVPTLSVKECNSRVVLIAFGIGDQIRLTTPRTQDHLRGLEQACARSGVGLETCSYNALTEEFRMSGRVSRFGSAADQVSVLGFMVWNVALPHTDELFAVLRSITRSGKPLAFLDEIGALKRAPLPADLATVRAFEMATSTGGGQVVGRYLYNLGHRRVAALCGSPGAFGRERALGLASAMRTAGVSDAVHILESTSRRSLDEPRVTIRLSTNLGAAVDKRLNGAIPSIFIAEQKIHLALAVRRELQRPLHQPLFERALAMPGVSAWVTDTDAFALDALSFLAGRGVRVPQDLSVVGFDDSLEAAFYRLSSYNFNGAAVTDAMLAYLLKPGRAVGQSRAPEIEGYVTERATTGKAR